MLVQRVLMPDSPLESWTVLGDEGGIVEPIERYLAYPTDIERSPNTVKAYAHDLKDWFVFLNRRGLDWREVRLEDLGEFVAWLRLPPAGRDGRVTLLPSAEHHCGAALEPVLRRRKTRLQPQPEQAAGFLRYAYTHLEDLAHGSGWESEFPRDVWELRRLVIEGTRARLRFDRIIQPWLCEPAKRFVRWRLSIGRSVNQAVIDILALNRFSGFLADPRVAADALARVDRTVLERYLAGLALDSRSMHSRSRDIGSLNAFFHAVRRHGWDHSLPANVTFYPDDFPRPDKRLPRALAEHVMAQVEQPANLERWHTPDGRALTLILMRCGLRVGDACHLAFDYIIRDADGAAYLRYLNRKMKREALVPIDEEVEGEIVAQQQRVLERWPGGSRWLFPAPRTNPDGTRPLTTHSYRGQLDLWLERCDVRDEHGRPVHLTPHQWRHTFGTRLINRDVPQEVVRVLLDHSSGEMTAHYARLHDSTTPQSASTGRRPARSTSRARASPSIPTALWLRLPGPSSGSGA
jgi:integrase